MTAITRHTEGLCCVCRGREIGLGYKTGNATLWICQSAECLEIAQRSGGMKPATFDRLEAEAAIQGAGNAFGAFLDERGWGHVFDGMPPELFSEAMKVAVGGYRDKLKSLVDENCAPF